VDSFLLALLLVSALASGGRDQLMVGQWADSLGRSTPLLLIAMASAMLAAGAMAWLGAEFAALLPRRAGQMLVTFALGLVAINLAWPVRLIAPREPTRSLGAIAIVLLARQVGDASRLAVFALAAWAALPLMAGLGGALAGAGAVALGWSIGAEGLARLPLRAVRLVLAASLLIAAVLIGLNARFAA
jgi:putative Ca2+/H+ antiporter (TMEM165/GDT1 family)